MLALLAVPATALLTIQTAKVDITPSEPLPLGGYTERGNKVSGPGGDHLYARAVLLTQGKVRIAVVSAEMLTIPESLYREVAARIPKDINLFLSATHTHSAPDSQMLNERSTLNIPGIANFRPRWLDWYAGKIASSIIFAASAEIHGARTIDVLRSKPGLNRGRRAGAVPDPWMTVIRAGGMHIGDSAIWAHYAAHAVFFGPDHLKLSGDWPSALSNEMGDVPVLAGAIGDVSPRAEGDTPGARISTFGRRLVDEDTKWVQRNAGTRPLLWKSESVAMNPIAAHPDFAKTNSIAPSLAQDIVSRFAPPTASISAFRIGKLAVVGVPGEPTSSLGRQIVAYGKSLGFNPVLVVSHVNGWMGYILDPHDYDRGGYEATLSFYGREEGAKVVDAAKKALRGLRCK